MNALRRFNFLKAHDKKTFGVNVEFCDERKGDMQIYLCISVIVDQL